MARIKLVETEETGRLIQRIFQQMESAYGAVPNTARALAQVPDFVSATAGLAKIESLEGPLLRPLKFLAKLRVAFLNQCDFCIDIGTARANKEALITPDKLAALQAENPKSEADWSQEEELILAYTDALVRHMTVSDELFAQVKERFTEPQIVELTAQIATETFYNILNRAWGIGAQGFSDDHANEEKGT